MCRRSLLLLPLVVAMVTGAERWSYSLVDNKYGDMLVAISEDVPEDLNLIQKIKDAFVMVSRDMLVATKRRAYIGNVTILVPKTWTKNVAWEPSGLETFNKANVIVDKANPEAQDNPYVNQPGECGLPGKYMHLTPRYLTDRRLARQWGPTGKTILHEFGHLRWGFFDEYPIPDEGYRTFYHSVAADGSTVVEPVRCSKMVYGEVKHQETGRQCALDPTTSLPEEKCAFFPPRDKRRSPATSSLMFWHFMTYTNGFCDNDPNDPLTYHNDEAPNKHNRKCKGKSQWEIMREHEDFRDNNNPPIDANIVMDTTPDFRIIQKGVSRLVFVIDVSGSMRTNSRLVKATQAAAEAIRDVIESGTFVAIVKFQSYAATVHQMIEVTDEASRQSLIDKLPQVPNGGTAIGKGLQEGMKLLENSGGTKGGKLILLSDGEETTAPFVKDVLPQLSAAEVIVDTIPLSDAADPVLLSLASKTGGNSLFTTDSDNSTSLKDAFVSTVTEESQQSVYVKVFGDTVSINPNTTYTQPISIDEEIGNKTEFVITWTSANIPTLLVELISPNGSRVPVPQLGSSKTLRISIPGEADAGLWTLHIKNNHGSDTYILQISVTSRSRTPGVKPITLTSELKQSTVNFSDPSSLRLIIFATLTKGYSPVVDANVYATVESSQGKSEVKLLDNGAGADITKEDGIYSAYFLDFAGDGGYAVKVNVQDDTGKAKLKTSKASGQQSAVDVCFMVGNCSTPQVVPVYSTVNSISRVTTAGSFQVINQPAPSAGGSVNQLDMFEPNDITDLTVIEALHETSTLKLQWTAVGDDLDQGTAAWYDLRMHTDLQTLRNQFSSAPRIEQSKILDGNLDQPQQAGAIETYTIRLDTAQKEVTYFFAIKAVDESNKTGDISNIVPAAFTIKEPPVEVGLDSSTTLAPEVTSSLIPGGLSTEAIVGLSVGCVAIVALIIIVSVVVLLKIKKGSKLSPRVGEDKSAIANPTYEDMKV